VGTPGDPTVVVPDDETIQVVVTGEQVDDDYFVPNASTATRTDTPLRDIPQSIQVIPRQVIEDQQATAIEDVLENAAGVTFLSNLDGQGVNFAIRGFENAPVLRDGFRLLGSVDSSGIFTSPEVANLERVEVLRGPASVLFGQAEPGGVINLVSKQPLSEPYYDLQLQLGNRGFIGPSLDLSGPLTEDGSVLYRLNALVRREDSFRNFDNSFERSFIAPALTWQISEQTDLTVNLEYIDDTIPTDVGTALSSDGEELIPAVRVTNGPDDIFEKSYLSAGYTLEHRFSENWQLRNQFSFVSDEISTPDLITLPFFLNESTGTLLRAFVDSNRDEDFYSLYTNVQGKFNTGSIQHTLLFGVDLARTEASNLIRRSAMPGSPLNIFSPDYSATSKPDSESLPLLISSTTTVDRIGIYLQDQIDLLDNLILVAGFRYDFVDRDITDELTNQKTNQPDEAVSPRIGILYQPIEPLSLYANYAQSFNPNGGTDAQGDPFAPEEGEGFEVGFRAELIADRLAATLAYFDITKQNVLTADPIVPFTFVATGEQRSRGVDFHLTGEILPGWNVIASYAYIDAEVTEDNTDIVGNRLPSIPEHSASLWTNYQIQSGGLEGLGFGIGFSFVDERQGNLANDFNVDSYLLTNAALFYRRDNFRFGLNIDNLFDISYIESLQGISNIRGNYPGSPLTVRASISYRF
ncbi:MAG: TonB-dependent receptor, partial [Cyanobacteria bacterium P01_H01_bin.15]